MRVKGVELKVVLFRGVVPGLVTVATHQDREDADTVFEPTQNAEAGPDGQITPDAIRHTGKRTADCRIPVVGAGFTAEAKGGDGEQRPLLVEGPGHGKAEPKLIDSIPRLVHEAEVTGEVVSIAPGADR